MKVVTFIVCNALTVKLSDKSIVQYVYKVIPCSVMHFV